MKSSNPTSRRSPTPDRGRHRRPRSRPKSLQASVGLDKPLMACTAPSGSGAIDASDVILMYESEARVLAGNAVCWGNLETGGELYGTINQKGHIVISLALGPGPNAEHSHAHYRMDIAFSRWASKILKEAFGLATVGHYHSHHGLGLHEYSSVDRRQIATMARLNDMLRLCGILVTTDCDRSCGRTTSHPLVLPPGRQFGNADARLLPFIYQASTTGDGLLPARIHILPGRSPFRSAALDRGILTAWEIAEHVCGFPFERVEFPARRSDTYLSDQTQGSLRQLCQQVQALPEAIRQRIGFSANKGFIVITVPLTMTTNALIAVDETPPHRVLGVHLHLPGNGSSTDVTKYVLAASEGSFLGAYATLAKASAVDFADWLGARSRSHEIPSQSWWHLFGSRKTKARRTDSVDPLTTANQPACGSEGASADGTDDGPGFKGDGCDENQRGA